MGPTYQNVVRAQVGVGLKAPYEIDCR